MCNSNYANFLVGLAFLAFSANASADWSRLGDEGESVIYVDAATLNKTAGVASIWILKDYRQIHVGPSREKYKSARIFYEFKCAEKLVRQSYLTRHYGAMGGAGYLSSDSRFHSWDPLVPGTDKEMLFEFACK